MGGDCGIVGFVGLDSFSFELASSLLRSGFKVQAFEISTQLGEKFTELGGCKCDSPADVGNGAAAVVVLLSHPDVITLRKMVKRERKRGDCMKIELEKERRAAESAAEEAMAMLLKLRMEKSVMELEANRYKRVAEQKQVCDQEVIQLLQWMLMKLDDREDSRLTL